MFIAQFKDGTSFAENQGYWDDCPDKGITALHITLPFKVMKKNTDGTSTQLNPSSVKISGFEEYYFANQRKSIMPLKGGSITEQDDGSVMAGVDRKRDTVSYFHIDPRGNVTFQRLGVQEFIDQFKVRDSALRKGDKWQQNI